MPKNDKQEDLQLRSENVQEVLNAVPVWMIRWGSTLVLFLILGLLCISWFVKYPDVITAEITVTATIPPAQVYATSTSTLDTVLVKNGEIVHEEQVLAILEGAGNYKDILLLKHMMDTLNIHYRSIHFPFHQMPSLMLGNLAPAFALFERDGIVLKQNMDDRNALENLIESYEKLKEGLNAWELKYVLRAPVDGQASFSTELSKNNSVNQDDLMFRIIPVDYGSFIGKINLSTQSLSKIQVGQEVLIDLLNYSKTEYGDILGTIHSISSFSDKDGNYLIDVRLPDQLITTRNKKIEFKQPMKGRAKVITEDLRLIERFFYRFKNMFS